MTDGLELSRRLVLPHLLTRGARSCPDKAALVFGGRRLTYAELDERTDRLAAALAARGVGRGDRVALLLHNGFEIVEAFFGCHKAGACAVPINFRLSSDEVAYILEDSGAVGVISDPLLAPLVAGAGFHLVAGGSYEDALAAAGPAPPPSAEQQDVAFLVYTSGTTGRPKGAMLTHQNLVLSTLSWLVEMQATADDVWLSGQPLFHIGGINGLLPFLYVGATVVVTPSTGFDAAHAIALMEEHATTMCIFVPTQWQDICTHPDVARLDDGRLRKAMWGAAAAPRATLELMSATFAGVEIISAFGQTEMAGATTLLKGPHSLRKMGSVGKPIAGVEVRIVDDDGVDVAEGEIGEIVYRGPTVMAGYHAIPDATAEAFAGGWFHSGDLVRRDGEGFLYVVDRKKDMIISGGENVYPAEVERVLLEHAAVAEVAVVGVAHPRWGETPLAVVVAAPGAAPTEAELEAHCRKRLAGYKKPSGVVFAQSLPRNAGGKVLKRELQAAHADRFSASAVSDAAAGLRSR